MCFVKEKPLAAAVEHDVLSESILEGNILISVSGMSSRLDAQMQPRIWWRATRRRSGSPQGASPVGRPVLGGPPTAVNLSGPESARGLPGGNGS